MHDEADSITPESKRSEQVVVETATHVVRGRVSLPTHGYRARFSDLLNRSDLDFLALTDVERTRCSDDSAPTRHSFLAVARGSVLFGYPDE